MSSYGYGLGWIALIMPYIEQGNLYDSLDYLTVRSQNQSIGWVGSGGNVYNAGKVDGIQLPLIFCPSSPLLPMALNAANNVPDGVASPTYTAINGSVNYRSTFNRDNPAQFQNPSDLGVGILSFGGVITGAPMPAGPYASAYRPVLSDSQYTVGVTGVAGTPGWYQWGATTVGNRIGSVTDGTSNTIMLGEQSDWCRKSDGTTTDCRSDYSSGFILGNCPWNEWRIMNATTVRYAINNKDFDTLGGPSTLFGFNYAIQSCAPGRSQRGLCRRLGALPR